MSLLKPIPGQTPTGHQTGNREPGTQIPNGLQDVAAYLRSLTDDELIDDGRFYDPHPVRAEIIRRHFGRQGERDRNEGDSGPQG